MVSQALSTPEARKGTKYQIFRFSKYLLLATVVNGFVLYSTKNYLDTTPSTYTSELVFNVAGAGGGVNLNLPDIGQAVTSSGSNFSSKSDPRENYKVLISGKSIQEKAAKNLGIEPKDLGAPRPSIIANTTTMKVEMNAESPEEAHKRVIAVYDALYARLEELRLDEQIERNKSIQKSLLAAQEKLSAEQKRVSNYKLSSGLNSMDQISNLIQNIESLRAKRSTLIGERSQVNDQLERLSRSLKMSPDQAADALTLQTDQQLRTNYTRYTEATSELNTLLEYRGENYPDVVNLRQKQATALQDSLARAQAILNRPVEQQQLETLLLENGGSSATPRGSLFQSLVEKDSQLKGIDGELVALQTEIKMLESRLSVLTQKEAVLSDYVRQMDIAEAVFAATLAKIDLGRGDLFASYPLIQVFEDATMPYEASAPKPKLVMIGAILACSLVTIALTLGWYRKILLDVSKKFIRGIAE